MPAYRLELILADGQIAQTLAFFSRDDEQALGSCPQTWCKSVVGHCSLRRVWPVCQSATAGKLTMALSLKGAMVSSVM